MARRTDHTREELHALILDAAEKLIIEGGIDAFSTRAIAREIGYTSGTLYQYFSDSQDILLHINARTMHGLIEQLNTAGGLPDDPAQRIHAYADI
ncbi:MAG: helix-turn-helix domain-containing protein, partial [Pseudomonadota bacterium]